MKVSTGTTINIFSVKIRMGQGKLRIRVNEREEQTFLVVSKGCVCVLEFREGNRTGKYCQQTLLMFP